MLEVQPNKFRTSQPSSFSPSKKNSAESSNLFVRHMNNGKDPSENERTVEGNFSGLKNGYKAYEQLLKIAVANILIEMLMITNKKRSQSFTLNVSRLDLDRSPVIEEQEDSSSPSPELLKYKFQNIILKS